jgi:hypothetical protein
MHLQILHRNCSSLLAPYNTPDHPRRVTRKQQVIPACPAQSGWGFTLIFLAAAADSFSQAWYDAGETGLLGRFDTAASLDPPDWVAPRAGLDESLSFGGDTQTSCRPSHLRSLAAEKPSFPASSLLFPYPFLDLPFPATYSTFTNVSF